MNRWGSLLTIAAIFTANTALTADADMSPEWAYPMSESVLPPKVEPGTLFHVPDSSAAYTRTQILARFAVPDWHPEDHAKMPDIVSKGREPAVRPCAYCHQPTGVGRPENANLSGLTATYLREQMQAFKEGKRKGGRPDRAPMKQMNDFAKNITDAELDTVIAYFTSLKPAHFPIKVVESATAPKWTVIGNIVMPAPSGGTEPIGERIIEVPVDPERTEDRDWRSGFVAYAPPGSIKKGEALVTNGAGGKTIQCSVCHGPDLKGLGDVPRIVGLSPSYVIRQLYDIQHGTRSASGVALMQQVVAKMDMSDMVAVSAYLANQKP